MGNENEDDSGYEKPEPMWKSYLYQVQLKAPKPVKIACQRVVPRKPRYYGAEYHGAITREEAEHLVSSQEGAYLTRESLRQPGTYALTFRFGGISRNYKLYYDEDEGMHYVGEKRFESIYDLVADGLITMYVDANARDYIDHMALTAPPAEERPTVPTTPRPTTENFLGERKLSTGDKKKRGSFKPSEVSKPHNFKIHNFYGPHWCDHCRNFMWGLKAQGSKCQDCGYNAHKQCSQIVQPDCTPDKRLIKRVFGVDLTTLVKVLDSKRPPVVDRCVHEVEKRGLEVEGIYRVPGFQDDIEFLMHSIDKDGEIPNLAESAYSDINVIAGLLKLYFRLLPIPLIDFEAYGQFIEAVKLADEYEKSKAFQAALSSLSPAHYETLKYFAGHLQRVVMNKEKNFMSPQNLAIVFGPTLMRAPDSDTFQAIYDLPFQRLVIEYLVSNQDILFSS